LDQDTLVNVGQYCERLLADPTFQFISAFFEQTAVGEMLSTQAHEQKRRESIYARVLAHGEFKSQMKEFVDKMLELTAQKPKDQSDPDDPTVHEIYEGFVD
jgi:hypothetical protein